MACGHWPKYATTITTMTIDTPTVCPSTTIPILQMPTTFVIRMICTYLFERAVVSGSVPLLQFCTNNEQRPVREVAFWTSGRSSVLLTRSHTLLRNKCQAVHICISSTFSSRRTSLCPRSFCEWSRAAYRSIIYQIINVHSLTTRVVWFS